MKKLSILKLEGSQLVCNLLSLVACAILLTTHISAQEVSISPELSIRNYYAYELLGKISDRYLVYRDKGFIKEIDVFNEYMEHSQHSELIFEKKKTDMISAIGLDTTFQMVYGYLDNDSLYVKMRRYDKKVSLSDSSTITTIPKKNVKRRINSVVSEDKGMLMLYTLNKDDDLDLYLYDNDRNRLAGHRVLRFAEDINIKAELREVLLTDAGELLILLYRSDQTAGRDKLIRVMRYSLLTDKASVSTLVFEDRVRRDTYMEYDNRNKKLIVCGLYADKKSKVSSGIFLFDKQLSDLKLIEDVQFIPFSESLVDEVSRTKRRKNKIFEHFSIRDVVKRQDGGILMMLELTKEYSRRSSYSSNYDRSSYSPHARRGWVDYYNEDIIISSIDPSGKVDWSKILYKKQFSQDDEAVYSSFYTMLTPSRMRLLYNDEIKNSSTVSEYILDPVGKVARNSLLSTDEQDMKLRFRDAMQLSNNELIVPSENNFKLNLVRISYR